MTGLHMLLKSLGLNVSSEEIEGYYNDLKVRIPKFIVDGYTKMSEFEQRLIRIEQLLIQLKGEQDVVTSGNAGDIRNPNRITSSTNGT